MNPTTKEKKEFYDAGNAERTINLFARRYQVPFENAMNFYENLNSHKATCLEIFHERKLDFDQTRLKNCLHKLVRADKKLLEISTKLFH